MKTISKSDGTIKQQSSRAANALRDGRARELAIREAHAEKVTVACSKVVELAESNILETAAEHLLEILRDPNTNLEQKEIDETELFLLKQHADAGHIPEELFKVRQARSEHTPAKADPDPELNTPSTLKYWQKHAAIICCAGYPAAAPPSTADILRYIKQHWGTAPDRQTVIKWKKDPAFLLAVEERRSRPARRQEAMRDLNLRRAISRATDYRGLAKLRKVVEQAAKLSRDQVPKKV